MAKNINQVHIDNAADLVLEQLSTTKSKTQAELIDALRHKMNYGMLLISLRSLYDDDKVEEEMMDDSNFKWGKKDGVDG